VGISKNEDVVITMPFTEERLNTIMNPPTT
jgi:hypothetical protein